MKIFIAGASGHVGTKLTMVMKLLRAPVTWRKWSRIGGSLR